MEAQKTTLAVRQHVRYLCDLPAHAALELETAAIIKLSRSAVSADGRVPLRVVDLSRGGLGLASTIYFPPGAMLRLEISFPATDGVERLAVLPVVVRRTTMTDRTPSYYLGASFERLDTSQKAIVEELTEVLVALGATQAPEKSRA